MITFEYIYESCRNKHNVVKRRLPRRLKESDSDFRIEDELISDLEIAMNKVVSEYKSMDINRDQVIECIDEVCDVVKKNIEKILY